MSYIIRAMSNHILIMKIWMHCFAIIPSEYAFMFTWLYFLNFVCACMHVCVCVFHIFEYNCYKSPWCLGVIGSFIVVIYSVQEGWEDRVRHIENKIPIFNCCFTTGFLATKGDGIGCLFLLLQWRFHIMDLFVERQVHAAIRHCVWGFFPAGK